MKAEERKELQTNSLVRFIGRMRGNLRTGPSRAGTVAWVVVLVAILGFVGWWQISKLSKSRNANRWVMLDSLDRADPDELNKFLRENQGTMPAHMARLQRARQNLKEGLSRLYTENEAARKQLDEAVSDFDELLPAFKSVPILAQECLLGSGQAHEGLGKFDRAVEKYQALADRFKDSELARVATTRISAVEKKRDELAKLNDQIGKLPDPLAPPKDK